MIFNKHQTSDTTKKDKQLLCQVMDLMNSIADSIRESKNSEYMEFECHSICRAIAMHIGDLKVVDGAYLGLKHNVTPEKKSFEIMSARHSWLQTPDEAIIDPYPVGFISTNPVLVLTRGMYAPFGQGLYLPAIQATRDITGRKLWRKSLVLSKLFKTKPKPSS